MNRKRRFAWQASALKLRRDAGLRTRELCFQSLKPEAGNQPAGGRDFPFNNKTTVMEQAQLQDVENVIKNANEEQPNLTEMTKCMDKADRQGYTEQFRATEEGLELLSTGKFYTPVEIKVVNYFRDEGIS